MPTTRRRRAGQCIPASAAVLAFVSLCVAPAGALYEPDETFGGDGAVILDRGSIESGSDVETRGWLTYVGFSRGASDPARIWVARLLADGTPDITWSGDGFAVTPLFAYGTDIEVLPSGKVLVTGGNRHGAGLGV